MKLALYSDLHLEFMSVAWQPPKLDVDVVILAGDIAKGTDGIEWAARTFLDTPSPPPVLYVAGNHEYYGARHEVLLAKMRETAADLGIIFLENDTFEHEGVRFLGTTLWSDFRLFGDDAVATSMKECQRSIADYWQIHTSRGLMKPQDAVALFRKAAAWLEEQLARPFSGKTVVVTHFAPHWDTLKEGQEDSLVTSYFTVDMAPLMERYRIDFWAFGHTHYSVDFVAEDGCRVLSNQRGYLRELEREESGFRPELVIEI